MQICHEWNTVEHLSEVEARPGVRPLSYEDLERFFTRCDERVEEIRARRRKGALAALRDAQMFKTYYAWGLRRYENIRLDVSDLRRNPHERGSRVSKAYVDSRFAQIRDESVCPLSCTCTASGTPPSLT